MKERGGVKVKGIRRNKGNGVSKGVGLTQGEGCRNKGEEKSTRARWRRRPV